MGGVVDDQELFRFAIKVESCQKSRKILGDFLAVTHFFGAGIVKIVPNLSPLPCGASTEKKSLEDTPTCPEAIESNRLNFRPDF